MVAIKEIPTPMDWRVTQVAGNNAVEVVNAHIDTLQDMLEDTAKMANDALAQIGDNDLAQDTITFDPAFDPYVVATTLEPFTADTTLEDVDLNLPERAETLQPTHPGEAPNADFNVEPFTETASFEEPASPTGSFVYDEPLYQSELSDAIVAAALETMANGGKTLGGEIESAIWERAKDRIADEYEEEYDRVNSDWAAAGFDIPTGAHRASLAAVSNKRFRALEQANYEIAVEQARLALANYHKMVEIGVSTEALLKSFFNAVQDRALQAAVETVRQGLALYSTIAEYNKLKLLKFQAAAGVHSTNAQIKLQGAIAQNDFFKSKIQLFALEWQAVESETKSYIASVQAETAKVDAVLKKNQNKIAQVNVDLTAHTANQSNKLALEDTKAKAASINSDKESTMARLSIAAQDSNIRTATEQAKIISSEFQAVAEIAGRRFASLASAINISASLSDSEASAESLSHSYSHQDSTSANVSESYINEDS